MLNTNFRTVQQTLVAANNASSYAMPILSAAIVASKEVGLVDRITKAFGLTADQSAYVAQILAKDKKEGDKFEQEQKAIYYAASLKTVIDGRYTVISPSGQYRIIALTTNIDPTNDFFFGKQTVKLMVGSSNEEDFKSFGFFDPLTGISLFKKALKANQISLAKAKVVGHKGFDLQLFAKFASSLMIKGKEGNAAKLGFTLEVSKYCLVCSIKLTNPSSLNLSIGPKCYKDIHG
jgi:hypothetical protein